MKWIFYSKSIQYAPPKVAKLSGFGRHTHKYSRIGKMKTEKQEREENRRGRGGLTLSSEKNSYKGKAMGKRFEGRQRCEELQRSKKDL